MVEKIERVAGIKAVTNNVTDAFSRRQGYNDENGKSFAEYLKKAMKKTGGTGGNSSIPEAYRLELSTPIRATQSLFYSDASDIGSIMAKIPSFGVSV